VSDDWYREQWEGRTGQPRPPHEVTPGYAAGQQARRDAQRPIEVSPEAGAWMGAVIALPIFAALIAVAAAAVSGNDIGTWAAAAGGVAFVGMVGLLLVFAALGLAFAIIRAVLMMLPGLVVLAAFAAAVLLALSVFGVGPGLTFL
jgi:hypothetical protein